jgi:beta-barrel assembly-enhancing protease
MASDLPLKAWGQFFDGQTANAHRVEVTLDGTRLLLEGASPDLRRTWPLRRLQAADVVSADRPLRLRHEDFPGERLVLEDQAMADALKARSPQLSQRLGGAAILRFALVTTAGLLLVAAIGYGLLSMLPPAIARMMPEEWRERLGRQAEETFLGRFSECRSPQALRLLAVIGNRLYAADPDDAPDFAVRVYNLPMINAFALPGGRIVLSGKLIEVAKSPEEVAGVLAHELGHVSHRDPEAAIVRITGIQVLISLATGSDGGNVLSNLAGFAALLRYTRSAEVAADSYAIELLNKARIDPQGLKRFFESIRRLEEAARIRIGPLGGMLATHPATEERIARIKPLANGPALPVMSQEEWQALKRICRNQANTSSPGSTR